MSNIKTAIDKLQDPSKSIGLILMEFYENMREFETDKHKGGKQATAIVMAINDIEQAIKNVIMDHDCCCGKFEYKPYNILPGGYCRNCRKEVYLPA